MLSEAIHGDTSRIGFSRALTSTNGTTSHGLYLDLCLVTACSPWSSEIPSYQHSFYRPAVAQESESDGGCCLELRDEVFQKKMFLLEYRVDLWTLSSEENEKVVKAITTNALPLPLMSGIKAMACIHVEKILQNRKERKQPRVL